MSLITSQLEEPLIGIRLSSLCRAQCSMFVETAGAQASPSHRSFCVKPPSFHTPKDPSTSMGNPLVSCRNSCSCEVSSTPSRDLLLSRIRNETAVKTELSCTLYGHLKLIWSFIFNIIPIKAQQICA